MLKNIPILLLMGLLITAFVVDEVQADSPTIDVIPVEGVINPVLVDYIERGIDHA